MLKQKWQFGVTMTETLIVIGILGVLAALAVPSFTETKERRKIVAAAEAIQSDLRWARSEAIKRNADVTVTFSPGAGGSWSYTIDPGNKTVNSGFVSEFQNVELSENFTNDDTVFDRVRGIANDSGTITLTNPVGELHVILSIMGRARICSVNGSISSYETCNP